MFDLLQLWFSLSKHLWAIKSPDCRICLCCHPDIPDRRYQYQLLHPHHSGGLTMFLQAKLCSQNPSSPTKEVLVSISTWHDDSCLSYMRWKFAFPQLFSNWYNMKLLACSPFNKPEHSTWLPGDVAFSSNSAATQNCQWPKLLGEAVSFLIIAKETFFTLGAVYKTHFAHASNMQPMKSKDFFSQVMQV